MKRKIAILLAATMTLSAVPTFAVNTTAPKAVNTTTVASGQVIFEQDEKYKELNPDLNTFSDGGSKQKNATAYKSYLSNRDGLLNIELNSGNQFDGDIKKGTKFEIKLEGGKFTVTGKNDPAVAYRNTAVLVDNSSKSAKDEVVKYYVKDDENGNAKVYAGYMKSTKPTESELKETTLSGFIRKELETTSGRDISNKPHTSTNITIGQLDKVLAPLPTIPYSIEIKDETTATVEFLHDISYEDIKDGKISVPEGYQAKDGKKQEGGSVEGVRKKQVYLSIPLGAVVEATGEEEVKVHVDGYGSKFITDGTVTLAKSMGSGSTAIESKYIDKKVFESDFQPSDIIVRENIRGTFNEDQITVRLNSGFEFMGDGSDVTVTKASDNTSVLKGKATISEDKNKITFNLNKIKSNDKEAIKIHLPKIQPVDESKNYGEVSINIYGGGMSDQTITVGERQQLGFKLETKGDVPTIIKGRYAALNGSLKQNSNNTAEFEFSEVVPESLLTARSLDFNVPAGVKIVDVESITMTGVSYTNNMEKAITIKNDGKTLRFERNELKGAGGKSVAKIKLKLKLSIDAGFEGEEVKLAVTGGGSNETYETVIAKVASPFKVETKAKDINIGYQDYSVNDIVIEETEAGMFMEGGLINLAITAPYGTSEMGFTKAKVTAEGDVEIESLRGKDEYLSKDSISLRIKTKSTKAPSKITISDVKIGTTRSVPFGAYNLSISGNALINNDVIDTKKAYINGYEDKDFTGINFKLNSNATAVDKAARIDASTSNFTVPGYVNVVTANSTIDKEVKVSIGSTNATIDGQEVAMDVAPYIQGAGNTMVPLRFIAVALAGGNSSSVEEAQNSDKVSWDPASKTVTIFYGAGINQKIIQFKVGSSNMIVDGNVIPMEHGAKAEIKNDRTFVPFRALGQALGVSVEWDQETKTATYNKQ